MNKWQNLLIQPSKFAVELHHGHFASVTSAFLYFLQYFFVAPASEGRRPDGVATHSAGKSVRRAAVAEPFAYRTHPRKKQSDHTQKIDTSHRFKPGQHVNYLDVRVAWIASGHLNKSFRSVIHTHTHTNTLERPEACLLYIVVDFVLYGRWKRNLYFCLPCLFSPPSSFSGSCFW